LLAGVFVISLSGILMPGPMFTDTIARSYHRPWAGTLVALGHGIIEIPMILLIWFGFGQFFQNHIVQTVLSLAGGLMILWLGIGLFRARHEAMESGGNSTVSAPLAGIITSGLNPYFFLWWATVGSMLLMTFREYGLPGLTAFTVTHLACDTAWFSLISVLIYRTQKLWGKRVQEGIFIGCSIALFGFGIWYLVSGIRQIF
jgi:threonine/homoserine/homoserine lactone efflux protein